MSARCRGLLLDFNGVLTSNLFQAFGAFCRDAGLPHGALLELLTDDPKGRALLQDHERGSTTQPEFEQAIGQRLGIDGTGLVKRICQHLKPEPLCSTSPSVPAGLACGRECSPTPWGWPRTTPTCRGG